VRELNLSKYKEEVNFNLIFAFAYKIANLTIPSFFGFFILESSLRTRTAPNENETKQKRLENISNVWEKKPKFEKKKENFMYPIPSFSFY